MRRMRRERRTVPARVQMDIQQGQRSGNLVAEVDRISFSFGERQIVSDFSTMIMRGDKLGIIGPNGAGKTTLVRLLLGQLTPRQGTVRLGTNLQIAYFDQLREQLNDDKTVQDNVGDGYDSVQSGGSARHIIGYLQEFLFSPERARTLVRFLSGGERNRVLLARLFAKPANVIVLDEPTNDLDAETLELLEERLVQFTGTVLVVSHDRAFLNNVVTSTIVFEEAGIKEYIGGYDDWLRQRPIRPADARQVRSSPPQRSGDGSAKGKSQPIASETKTGKRRLTYKEQQEQVALPVTIAQLEAEIDSLHQAMAQKEHYQQQSERIAAARNRLENLESELASVYERWEELEQLSGY
jgi:ATP-binding cassette subfamily F protein uup